VSRSSFANFRWAASVVLVVLLLAQVTGHLTLPPVEALERQLTDAQLVMSAAKTVDERIVIVDIDDRALTAIGRWPWPRRHLAELIDRCFDHGAVIVGVDLILAEPDETSGLLRLEQLIEKGPLHDDARLRSALPELRAQLDDDGQLAAALRRHPVVLGFFLSDQAGAAAALPPPLLPAADLHLPDLPGHGGNLSRLQDAAGQAGFLNARVDADGLTRRSLLLARSGDAVYGSLPLTLAQQLLGAGTPEAVVQGDTLQGLTLQTARGPRFIGTGSQADVIIPYRAESGQYRRLSAGDLFDAHMPEDRLRAALEGKVVLLGATAAGLMDRHAVPLQASYAGVAAHASVLSGLLDGALPHPRPDAPALGAMLILLIAGVLLATLPRLSFAQGALLGIALLAALLGHHAWAWRSAQEAWPLAAPLLLLVGLCALHWLLDAAEQSAARQHLQALFGQYMPASRVAEMARESESGHYTLESRNAELTVMFADVRGFSGISEKLRPAELAMLMNAYFSAMSDVVALNRGTLDKYIGDAVMAFWGAPQDDPEHARHAVLAARAMQARLAVLNQDFAARGLPQLEINIGINTGTMVVGDLGSQSRRAYTVLGHAVNVAARLQELCSAHGVHILIGEATHAQAGVPCRALGETTLRGQQSTLMIYAPID
jgi:adenylate cyclase